MDACGNHSKSYEATGDGHEQNSPKKKVPLHLKTKCWSTDVWSLGTILLEIVTGVPIWIHHHSHVRLATGNMIEAKGLLGLKSEDRDWCKIADN